MHIVSDNRRTDRGDAGFVCGSGTDVFGECWSFVTGRFVEGGT